MEAPIPLSAKSSLDGNESTQTIAASSTDVKDGDDTQTQSNSPRPETLASATATREAEADEDNMTDSKELPKQGSEDLSDKLVDQVQNLQSNLTMMEQSVAQHSLDRSQMTRMLESEHVLAPMPNLLADVEKMFYNSDWQRQWNQGSRLGYHTELAINSLERHLTRLQSEKSQLAKLEEEMHRLRGIEIEWDKLQRQKRQNEEFQPNVQSKDAQGEPHEDFGAEKITEAVHDTDAAQDPAAIQETSIENAEVVPPPEASEDIDTTIPELNHVEWADFHDSRLRPWEGFAMDILRGEPVILMNEPARGLPWWMNILGRSEDDGKSKLRKPAVNTKQTLHPGQAPLPERIRIKSTSISRILDQTMEGLTDAVFEEGYVMTRPFKLLVCLEKQIRQKLEHDCPEIFQPDHTDVAEGTAPPGDGSQLVTSQAVRQAASSEENSKSYTADSKSVPEAADLPRRGSGSHSITAPSEQCEKGRHKHLRCLASFMDEIRTKQSYINSDRCQKVTFVDLWYLFKPGDEVIGQNGRQAYRIIRVTSAGHKYIPPWRNYGKEQSNASQTPINLHCVYIDFDGKEIGPVSRTVKIPRFDGEKPINSLEVFPLRYASMSRKDGKSRQQFLREALIERGKMFLDVTTYKHMHYNGLTLDTRDEVDSHVVVDFEEAFLSNADRQWKPCLENLILAQNADEDSLNEETECKAECCEADQVLQDRFAETARNREYFAGLIPDDPSSEPSLAIYPRDAGEVRYSRNELSSDDLVIMSYRVFGFVLRSRKWAQLDLTYLGPPVAASEAKLQSDEGPRSPLVTPQQGPPEFQAVLDTGHSEPIKTTKGSISGISKKRETAFDQLVLPQAHKRMLLSLIAQHFRDKEASRKEGANEDEQVDIVRGKGKGLIILLHGAPGVGKTSTAEGIAELFEKPLFQITCGDLGNTAENVDAALSTHFNLANKWGCVLLLDEADVFLASRSKEDFVRNGLVSVFLRVLEYYAGILFLTTNRVGDFDEAFASRIHISLYYPQLKLEATKDIFKLNFRMIERRFRRKRRNVTIEQEDILDYVEDYWIQHSTERWNGRQIRNACQTALALAEFDAQGADHEQVIDPNALVELKVAHLETVSTAYLEFMDYLSKVRDKDAERWAKAIQIRAREMDIHDKKDKIPDRARNVGGLHTPTRQQKAAMEPLRAESSSQASRQWSTSPRPQTNTPGNLSGPPNPYSTGVASPPQPGGYPPFPWPYPWPPTYTQPQHPGATGHPGGTATAGPGSQQVPQGWPAHPSTGEPWSGYGRGFPQPPPPPGQ